MQSGPFCHVDIAHQAVADIESLGRRYAIIRAYVDEGLWVGLAVARRQQPNEFVVQDRTIDLFGQMGGRVEPREEPLDVQSVQAKQRIDYARVSIGDDGNAAAEKLRKRVVTPS